MGSIQNLDDSTIHTIATNQVVVSLSVAVKELVENSLDAGATVINIKFGENGKEYFEVTDNGTGIDPENYEKVVARHCTSKLEAFDDLESIGTFGFRGEALSALAAISTLTISSKTNNQRIGAELEYDRNGKIINEKKCIRKTGTTVKVEKLFHRLPVRRTNFIKNEKREIQKTLTTLMAYALMTGARFVVQSSVKGGIPRTVMQTRETETLKSKLSNIFGDEISKSLEVIPEPKPTIQTAIDFFNLSDKDLTEAQELAETALNKSKVFELSGYISSISSSGRTSPDRQFWFINKRPVDLSFLSRILNTEWRRKVSSKKYPIIIVNCTMAQSDVDVNLAPDKRTVLVKNRKYLEFQFKAMLNRAWVTETGLQERTLASFEMKKSIERPTSQTSIDSFVDRKAPINSEVEQNLTIIQEKNFLQNQSFGSEAADDSWADLTIKRVEKEKIQTPIDNFIIEQITDIKPPRKEKDPEKQKAIEDAKFFLDFEATEKSKDLPESDESFESNEIEESGGNNDLIENTLMQFESTDLEFAATSTQLTVRDSYEAINCNEVLPSQIEPDMTIISDKIDHENLPALDAPKRVYSFSFDKLEQNLKKEKMRLDHDFGGREFTAELGDNEKAEEELRRKFNKQDFDELEIIGQFNKGFIIAKRGRDLFIIDQHASDEKFNYEKFLKEPLKTEKMMYPKKMKLNAGDTEILREKMKTFNQIGFKFMIDDLEGEIFLVETGRIGKELLDESDVTEMIFRLAEGEYGCLPSKIGRVCASRACRSSVMIGASLTETQMKRILNNLAKIEHPWNCPHGRPTMRHLANLDLC